MGGEKSFAGAVGGAAEGKLRFGMELGEKRVVDCALESDGNRRKRTETDIEPTASDGGVAGEAGVSSDGRHGSCASSLYLMGRWCALVMTFR